MHEATFHIRGGGAYEVATSRSDATIELWCNDHCDLLHMQGATDTRVLEEVEAAVGVEDIIEREDELVIVTAECLRPHIVDNIEHYLAKHGCLFLPPLRYEQGGKVVRVLALDPENLTRFYQDIQSSFSVTVRSKREIDTLGRKRPLLSLDSLIPDLSPRQREALGNAWDAGYYEIPRGVTTAELAATIDIDRRTFEEHLRLAEQKIIGAIVAASLT